jgi:hypothetical protein
VTFFSHLTSMLEQCYKIHDGLLSFFSASLDLSLISTILNRMLCHLTSVVNTTAKQSREQRSTVGWVKIDAEYETELQARELTLARSF